jgi:hypothetical protein
MMKLPIQDFRISTNGRAVNGHRLVQGFVPPYVDMARESVDTKFRQKLFPEYPLVASPTLATVASHTGQYPVVMLPNESDTLGDILYTTNLWEFFSSDGTALGIPNGTPASNVGIDALIYNGKLLTSHPLNTLLYHGAISGTPTWTASTGDALTSGNIHILTHFDSRVHCTNASSGAFARSDEILIVNPDFSVEQGITLGDTWDIRGVENYLDRYVLIFAQKTTSPRLSPFTTVFLWDGSVGSTYEQKFTLEGLYRTSIVKDTTTYVFTQLGTTVVCYYFSGGGFVELGRIKNTVIGGVSSIPKSKVTTDGDYFVLLASSSGLTARTAPLYWKPATGEAFYLTKEIKDRNFETLAIAQKPASSTFEQKRFFSFTDSGNGTIVSAEIEGVGISIVTDTNPFANQTDEENLVSTNKTRIAQSFTSQGGKLSKASFFLKKVNFPTGTITAHLWSHTGTFGADDGLPGTLLATATTSVDVSLLTGSFQVIDFNFAPYQLVDGTHYFVGIEFTGGSGTNNLRIGNSAGGSDDHPGRTADFDGTWAIVGTAPSTRDLVFAVTETLPTTHTYKSNVIPAPFFQKDVHRNMAFGRMEIKSVEVEYNALPPTTADGITLSLISKDNYETETYATATAIIKNTTANSTNAQVGVKRAILNLGAKCTEFEIDLTATVATSSWDLIIRRIIVNYEPISVEI